MKLAPTLFSSSRLCFAALSVAGAFMVRSVRAEAVPILKSLDEPDSARDARVAWHEEARFGCFVHWGVYSALGGEWHGKKAGTYSEHIMRSLKIPRQVYLDDVARAFDPEKFDADSWVKLMHEAGMRYLIITAKHHDGFAMYPSKVSDYNLTSVTRFKRDPMRELKEACTKYGLKFGFYYSHAFDWEHPDAPGNDWDYDNPGGDKKLHGGEFWYKSHPELVAKVRHYVDEKSIPQIKELLLTYHPDIIWFDTPSKLPPEENRRILEAVRATDSHVVVNGRLLANYGDYKNTADRPAEVPYVTGHWEGIPTTNDSYGWSRIDQGHKPPGHFIQLLAKIVSKGGNMLMNIGPMGDGEIDPKDQTILRGIGSWMQQNSESIYGADRTPLSVQAWGTSTAKPQKLFLHVFHWPSDGHLLVAGLQSNPTHVQLLADAAKSSLTFHRVNGDDLEVNVPKGAPDPVDSVVVLDFAEPVRANAARLIPAQGDATKLHVFDGQLVGQHVKFLDGKRDRDATTNWTNQDSGVDWNVRLTQAAHFHLTANYSSTEPATETYQIAFGDQVIEAKFTPTSGDTHFTTIDLGEINLPAGERTISVRPLHNDTGESLHLRQLELTPVTAK